MSEPLTITELDEQTRADLTPCCDGDYETDLDCSAPAEWVVTFLQSCHCYGPLTRELACNRHASQVTSEPCEWCCCECDAPSWVVSVVPL